MVNVQASRLTTNSGPPHTHDGFVVEAIGDRAPLRHHEVGRYLRQRAEADDPEQAEFHLLQHVHGEEGWSQG